jgi:hypothetical protein
MLPGKYCAWCGVKYGEAKDGEVSHGICTECRTNLVEPELQRAREERENADKLRVHA